MGVFFSVGWMVIYLGLTAQVWAEVYQWKLDEAGEYNDLGYNQKQGAAAFCLYADWTDPEFFEQLGIHDDC